MRRSRAGALGALLSLTSIAACLGGGGDRPSGDPCSSSSDCASGLVCQYGRCRAECSFDMDCPEGMACVAPEGGGGARVCTVEAEGSCFDDGCPPGLICGPDDVCREECEDEEDCLGDRVCVEGVCAEPESGACDVDDDSFRALACGGADCDDGDEAINPEARELCGTGVDENCDGLVDPWAWRIGEEVQVSFAPEASWFPALVWTGSEYGVAWRDERVLPEHDYFVRLSHEGERLVDDDLQLSAGEISAWTPSIAWRIREFGVAFRARDVTSGDWSLLFARITEGGELVDPAAAILRQGAERLTAPSLVSTDAGYALAWRETVGGADEARVALLDDDMTGLTEPATLVGGNVVDDDVHLSWTGSELVVVWSDGDLDASEVAVARLDSEGRLLDGPTEVTELGGSNRAHGLVWTGTEHAVPVRSSLADEESVGLLRISADLSDIDLDSVSDEGTSPGAPSLAWTGEGYGMAWHAAGDADEDIFFIRIDPMGEPVGSVVRVSEPEGVSREPALVRAGTELGVVWHDDRLGSGNWEIYFARIGLCAE